MRTNHMTVLQLHGPMAFHVLQWCHPMLASTKGTSCCTQMITLYGARKWIQARAVSVRLGDHRQLQGEGQPAHSQVKWCVMMYCLVN